MRLHLPLPLRAALLALLVSFSISHAAERTKLELGTDYPEQSHTLSSGTPYDDYDIYVYSGGTFELSGGYSAYNSGSSATINVDGGTFTMNTGSTIAYNSGSSAEINVDGGTFEMKGGMIARESGSSAEINVYGGTFAMKSDGMIARYSGSRAEINVDGGTFEMSGGYIS